MFRLGSFRLGAKCPVQLKAVSSAMYPVPINKAIADKSSSPNDVGVPSSSIWKPTTALRRRTQRVATIAPRWAAVKPWVNTSESSLRHHWEAETHHSDSTVEGEAPNGEDLTYLDDNVPNKEQLHFSTQRTVSANGSRVRDHDR